MSGCFSTDIGAYRNGTEVTPMQTESFIVGETTSDQVLDVLGAPQRREEINGKIYWYYEYTIIRHIGGNDNTTTTFEFNADDVLIRYYKSKGRAGKTGNALLDAANGNS